MPRRIDEDPQKRGFSIVDSRRVKKLFVHVRPSRLHVKGEDEDHVVYTLTVEVTIGTHDRSAIVSAFRRLGVWFEEETRPSKQGEQERVNDKTRNVA